MNVRMNSKRYLGRVVFAWMALAVVLLCGCATRIQPPRDMVADKPLWQGKLSVRVAGAPAQSLSANFILTGDANEGVMELESTLGTTLAKMQWSEKSARLQTAQGARDYANLEELTLATLGAKLPLHAVFDWLSGRATPTPGWQLDLSERGIGRIQAQRSDPRPQVDLKIALEL
ncbi:MAG: hypothetical protein CFE44_05830 [Burkholderiales bacterium PBB4]|nr:MAG: hypothetical protein CFE44_05830 [Burkholderiales bacterium PBB4]